MMPIIKETHREDMVKNIWVVDDTTPEPSKKVKKMKKKK